LSEIKSNGKYSYSVFPGQIVAVEGYNATGHEMVAEQIHEGSSHVPLRSPVKDLFRYHHSDSCQGGSPLRILTAAGPYTSYDNFDYKPLEDLMNVVRRKRPDVVIFCGPFVDSRQQEIAEGNTKVACGNGDELPVPYDFFFSVKISSLLGELYDLDPTFTTQFVLVPSLDDATAEWV
jgi:DNA polymerase alpha subunit B